MAHGKHGKPAARRRSARGRGGGAAAAAGPRARSSEQLWLYGSHTVLAALANPERRPVRLLMTAEAMRALGPRLEALGRGPHAAVASEVVPREPIDALLPEGAVHQGVALEVGPLPTRHLEDVYAAAAARDQAVVVVLDRISDPQNLGAALRSAAVFGALAVIVPERHSPEVTGAVAKAASGGLERVPLVRVANLARALAGLKAAGFWCVGLDPAAETTLAAADLGGRVALVVGAEGAGLRRLTRESCDLLLRVAVAAGTESLNLAAATAVALYEIARQQPDPEPPSAAGE